MAPSMLKRDAALVMLVLEAAVAFVVNVVEDQSVQVQIVKPVQRDLGDLSCLSRRNTLARRC
jgi:hypothetical protein